MKKRLRDGAKLIVVDPRKIDLVRSPHIKADYHLPLRPGTNVAVVTRRRRMLSSPKWLMDEAFIRERCEWDEFQEWVAFVSDPRHSPEAIEKIFGRSGRGDPRRRTPLCDRRQRRYLLWPRRDRAQPGLHDGDGYCQAISPWPAMSAATALA